MKFSSHGILDDKANPSLLLCFIDAIVQGEIFVQTGIHNFIYMIESKIHD